uniref:Pre T-cell antigen receptor alpha n=1 Tax=Neovison vison TaxID=452646 RepID=A0A8C7B1U0_NEOVI
MARTWLLLLLALGCPALPTGVGGTPFPSLAPPITLLVDGKQQTLVVCLVLDVAPPGFGGPIWFSAGNGSSLDAFTYGPSPEADGTWTSLAQLSLPSEELAAWENLVCHTGPEAGDRSQSTRPLQLQPLVLTARLCPAGTRGQALRLGALRLLLFKLLLLDVLLTCSRLRAPPSALGDPGLPAPPTCRQAPSGLPQPPPAGGPSALAAWIGGCAGGATGPGLTVPAPLAPQPHRSGQEPP